MSRLFTIVLMSAVFGGCSSERYDDAWGTEDIAAGKADGILDGAQKLAFDEVGSGFVEDEQMDVFAIDLKGGDKITATMKVTSGTLNPHFTLYFGGSTHVESATFSRTTTKIVKTYALTGTGRYYVAVRAYQNEGAGKYTFAVACNGGPCSGEPVTRVLSVDEQAECIGKARVCSFAALPQWNGNVGPARARTIFETCLTDAQTTEDAVSCKSACDEAESAKPLCNDIIAGLPFYADASASCLAELDDCLDVCQESGSTGADELWTTAESICWTTGFNGTCDSFARGHKKCGGTYTEGSNAECHAFCQSTQGAWTDDLDTLCEDACD